MPESRISHFQFVFEDAAATPMQRDIAQAYWSLEDDGAWTYKTADLVDVFSLPNQFSALSMFRGHVKVRVPGLCCHVCGELTEIRDRNQFKPLLRELIAGRAPAEISSTCKECAEEEAKNAAVAAKAKMQAILAPQKEALACYESECSIDYSKISLKHSLMTQALMYAFGGNYKTRRIPSWVDAGKPPLTRTKDELLDTLRELYSLGIIVPDPDGPLQSVILEEDGQFTFNLLETGFLLARSIKTGEVDYHDELWDIFLGDQYESLRDFYKMVAIIEMKDYFLYLHDRFRYRSDGITEKVLEAWGELLDELSLGQAMRILYLTMTRLASKVTDKEYHPRHVANMIPGGFALTLKKYQSEGWPIEPFDMRKDACLYATFLFGNLFPVEAYGDWFPQVQCKTEATSKEPA